MLTALAIALGLLTSQPPALDLMSNPQAWKAGTDHGGTKMSCSPAPGGGVKVRVQADGDREDYPKITLLFKTPQDWTGFNRLRLRVRVDTTDPEIRRKHLSIVLYDLDKRREDLPGRPLYQQILHHWVDVGQWTDIDDWIVQLQRRKVPYIQIYLYELPPARPHEYTWQIQSVQLQSLGSSAEFIVFDSETFPARDLRDAPPSRPVASARCSGLSIAVDRLGRVASLQIGSAKLSAQSSAPTGLLIRDAQRLSPPKPLRAPIRRIRDGFVQQGKIKGLGVAASLSVTGSRSAIRIAGAVRDLRGTDRCLTAYFALPLPGADWTWWDDMDRARPIAGPAELWNCQTGCSYGAGLVSRYPIAVCSRPSTALSMAIRLDKPVIFRFFANPSLHLLVAAFDFGLVPIRNIRGRRLDEARFELFLYPADPAWPFRSALANYYELFPQLFEKRVPVEGGWFVWGTMEKLKDPIAAGFAFHWGPRDHRAVKFDNKAGTIALNYIEPEFFQQSMGDFHEAPTYRDCLNRLTKVAAGDPSELAKVRKLSYYRGGCGHGAGILVWLRSRSLDEFARLISQATLRSVDHDPGGQPIGMIGRHGWIGDSGWAIKWTCNLDPDIPRGKGWFNSEVALKLALQWWQEGGARIDGIALDSFGGYGNTNRVNFRRDHFRFSDLPLTYSGQVKKPCLVHYFQSWEWLRELARQMRRRGMFLMANCTWGTSPVLLQFYAPYLDIIGAEAPRFADPERVRAIAGPKPCCDLPYKPRPEWEVKRHLLYAIYPGHGTPLDLMRRYVPLIRRLSAAGWKPITLARVQPDFLKIERYGQGREAFLVIHNPRTQELQARIVADTRAMGLGSKAQVSELLSGQNLGTIRHNQPFQIRLQARDTILLRLRSRQGG